MAPNGCNLVFFRDSPELIIREDGKPNIEYVNRDLLGEVIVTPVQFKQLASWMNRNIQIYEKRFGEIKLRPEDKTDPPNFIT